MFKKKLCLPKPTNLNEPLYPHIPPSRHSTPVAWAIDPQQPCDPLGPLWMKERAKPWALQTAD